MIKSWFELAAVMLKDKQNNVELTLFTEAYPVASEDIAQLQMYTPQDFAQKWSGYSCRLPEKNFNFNSAGQSTVLSYDTYDTVMSMNRMLNALKSLASLYKGKLLNQMTNQSLSRLQQQQQQQQSAPPLGPPPMGQYPPQ